MQVELYVFVESTNKEKIETAHAKPNFIKAEIVSIEI